MPSYSWVVTAIANTTSPFYDLQLLASTISLRSVFLVAEAFVVVAVAVSVIVYIFDVYVDAVTCRSGAATPQRFADPVHIGQLRGRVHGAQWPRMDSPGLPQEAQDLFGRWQCAWVEIKSALPQRRHQEHSRQEAGATTCLEFECLHSCI